MKYFILILLICGWASNVNAQQQPLNTQYMFNGLVINPAYAGSHKALSATLHARRQWTGIEGAPETQTFSVHAPFNTYKTGVGLVVSRDRHSIFSENAVHGSYAYRIKLKDGFFSMGLQAGVVQLQSNVTEALALNPGDPLFSVDLQKTSFNFGGGIYRVTEKYYWGISIPQLLDNRITTVENLDLNARRQRNFFLSGGYLFDLNPKIKLRTQGLVKLTKNSPVQIEANAMTIFNDLLWVGLSWRSFADASGIMQIQLNKQFRIGYSYDLPTSSDLHDVTVGSHEFMINYKIKIHKQKICYTYF